MSDPSVPRLLPLDPQLFLNRSEEFDEVSTVLRDAADRQGPALIWLTGPPGVGKTTLAVWLGHRFAEQFTDGQLFYDLRGSMPGGAAPATDVLAYFLGRLGKTAEEIPTTEHERAADFRSLTSGRRILVLLDDAHTAAQVRTLLPASTTSAVLVTSRRHLDGLLLAGFDEVRVGEFTPQVAAELVASVVDPARLAAEPDATHQLITLCGCLPLALWVVATRVAVRHRRPLAEFVEMFADDTLARLQIDGDAPVSAVFDACYEDLPADQQAAYRLFGLHPGPRIGLACAAALLDVPLPRARDLLDGLVDAYLLQETPDDGYRFHSLIGQHAHDRAIAVVHPLEQRDALVRLVTWYWHRAVALGKVVSPRWTVGEAAGQIAPAFDGPDSRAQAVRELESEAPNILAVAQTADELNLDDALAGLCQALKPWYYDTDRTDDLIALLRRSAPAAERIGDPRLAMRLRHDLGAAHEKLGEFAAALEQFELSRTLAVADHDALGEASSVEWQGLVHRQLGDHDRAMECYRAAWEIVHDRVSDPIHRPRALALLRLHMGTELTLTNQADVAVAELAQARSWFAAHDEPVNEARALSGLARAHAGVPDRLENAADHYQRAASLFERHGFGSQQAEALAALADVQHILGRPQEALKHARLASTLFQRLGQWTKVNELRTLIDGGE